MKKLILFLLAFTLIACAAQPVTATAPAVTATPAPVVIQNTPAPTLVVPTEFPTFTPTPSAIPFTAKISPVDGMTQLFVPEGSVYMGGLDILLESDELPAHRVKLDSFWIDQVEVTNAMYTLCAQAGVCRLPVKINSDNRADYFVNPEYKDYPIIQVSWYDASAYCGWAGRRLPTEAAWERAARGDDMRNYPWGNEPPNERNSNANNLLGDTSRVGSFPEGASPFGALDMAGNVWEWAADYYDPYYYAKSPAENPMGSDNGGLDHLRVIRGGSFQDNLISLRISNRGYEKGPNPFLVPDVSAYYGNSSVKIGFRCVE